MILTRNDSGEQEGDIGQPVHVMVCLCMSEEDGILLALLYSDIVDTARCGG